MSANVEAMILDKQGTLQTFTLNTSHGRPEGWEKPIRFSDDHLRKKLYQASDWSYDNFH